MGTRVPGTSASKLVSAGIASTATPRITTSPTMTLTAVRTPASSLLRVWRA